MELSDIKKILEETTKNSENDELIKKYTELISAYLSENKLNDELVSLVVNRIDIDRASNLFDYLESLTQKDVQNAWKQIRDNKTVAENVDNNGLKLIAGLLSLAVMKVGNIECLTETIITKLTSMIEDEKKPITKESYSSVLSDFFVEDIVSLDELPNWDALKLPGNVNKRFALALSQIVEEKTDAKYMIIRRWASSGVRYANEQIEKEVIEAKIPKSKISDLQALVDHYTKVEMQLKESVYEIAKLEKDIKGLQDEIGQLNLEKRSLEREIIDLKGNVVEHQEMIKEKEIEIAERKKFNEAADALKKNDEEGLLRDIANELKAEFSDFKDSENDAMDEQLGEIYREKLRNIFKILAKKGIRME